MRGNIPGILLLIAGIIGVAPVAIDKRIAWALVAVAGLLMVLPI